MVGAGVVGDVATEQNRDATTGSRRINGNLLRS